MGRGERLKVPLPPLVSDRVNILPCFSLTINETYFTFTKPFTEPFNLGNLISEGFMSPLKSFI